MSFGIAIQFLICGEDAGPFDLYSDVDNFVTPFETGISADDLLAGYWTDNTPDGSITVRVQSTGVCQNYIDLAIQIAPTPTVTSTPNLTATVTPTNTVTPTVNPTNTATPSETPTNTPTNTPTETSTATPGASPTNTPTNTSTPSVTPTNTVTSTVTPSETPTNIPTNTPTNTATNTVTPTVTPTNTPTSTQQPICAEQIIVSGGASGTEVYAGTYNRLYSYSGGTFQFAYQTNSAWYIDSPDTGGNYGVVYGRNDGTNYYTLCAFAGNTGGTLIDAYAINSSVGTYSVGIVQPFDTLLTNTVETIGNVKYPTRGLGINSLYVSYPEVCPTTTPTPTITQTPTVTPTTTSTPFNTPSSTPTETPTNTATTTVTPTNTPSITPTNTPTTTPACYTLLLENNDSTTIQYTYVQCNGQGSNIEFLAAGSSETICSRNTFVNCGSSPAACANFVTTVLGTCPLPSPTPTVTSTVTPTNTITPTNTQTPSVTPTNTTTPSVTPSITPTNTPTNTITPSITPTNTPTNTTTPSVTPTNTPTNTATNTPTNTTTPTTTPTPTTECSDWLITTDGASVTFLVEGVTVINPPSTTAPCGALTGNYSTSVNSRQFCARNVTRISGGTGTVTKLGPCPH